MTIESWRRDWSPFRVKHVEETARCIAEQRALASPGVHPTWAELTSAGRAFRVEAVAALFDIQDAAMENLIARGELPDGPTQAST